MFKFCVILTLCVYIPSILCLSEEMEELAKQLHQDCQGQTDVAEELIQEIQAKKGFPDDEKLKCYMKCLMTEMGVAGDDGLIDVEAAIAVMPEEIKDTVEPTMRKCGAKVGVNPCDSVYQTHKCYYETDPVNYMIV